ncbi:hypothetical protein C8R46DRAFT_360612 [Mycena filopes]|nr:hypothetical protein C8R46DRAFT_360612 [Mycena filopes]
MSGLPSFSEYLLLLVFLELELTDIVSLRRVCRSFNGATYAKLLWSNLLKLADRDGHVLPVYLKHPDSLSAADIEALVIRVSLLARNWKNEDLRPVNVWQMDVRRRITWLRIVNGNWLFVASSDHEVSKLSCWDLSLVFQGYAEPIAEAYLAGQVETAQLEIQELGVVLALSLATSCPSVQIVTLRQHMGSHCFVQLCRIERSSHVLLLRGPYIGCALRDGAVVPHLVDWVARTIHDLPPPPGGFDTPERRCTPHLFVIWKDFVVVVRHKTLDLYTRPSGTRSSRYVKSLSTVPISEVVVLNPLVLTSGSALRLLVISACSVQLITLDGANLDDNDVLCSHSILAETTSLVPANPWYQLTTSGDGRRAMWLGAGNMVQPQTTDRPHLISMAVPTQPSDHKAPLITWMNDIPHHPGLWAFPVLDFDDALGYTVIGNGFGELAIYSHAESDPLACSGLGSDFTDRLSALGEMLSLEPILLRMRPILDLGMDKVDRETAAELVAGWSDEDLGLEPPLWHTDWRPEAFNRWHRWLGVPGDYAWVVRHAFHLPGPITPQAHGKYHDMDMDDGHVVLRVGKRHIVYQPTSDDDRAIRSLPLGSFNVRSAQLQPCMRPTVFTVSFVYAHMVLRRRYPDV